MNTLVTPTGFRPETKIDLHYWGRINGWSIDFVASNQMPEFKKSVFRPHSLCLESMSVFVLRHLTFSMMSLQPTLM